MYDMDQVSKVFDALSDKIKTELDDQFNKGRLKGTDYANVYSNLMNTVLQLSNQAPLNEKQSNLLDEQMINVQKDNEVKEAQVEFTKRQTKGFDDNIKLKLFSAQLGTWGTMFSAGALEEKPKIISDDETSRLYDSFKSELSI